MRQFHFPLGRVLRWRETCLELAQAKSAALTNQAIALAAERSGVEGSEREARQEISHAMSPDAGDLSSIGPFLTRCHRARQVLDGRRRALDSEIATHQTALQEAHRAVRLLERLRDDRYEIWRKGVEREQEQFASEAYLARWIKET